MTEVHGAEDIGGVVAGHGVGGAIGDNLCDVFVGCIGHRRGHGEIVGVGAGGFLRHEYEADRLVADGDRGIVNRTGGTGVKGDRGGGSE